MQIKRLAALSLAAVLTAGMLTGCDLLAWLAWLEENSDSSSVTSSSSSSSTSRPSYDDEDDDNSDTGNTGDTGGEDTETPDDPNKPTVTLENNELTVAGGNGALTTDALKELLPEGTNKAMIATLDLSKSGYTSIGNLDEGYPLFIEHNKLVWSNLQSVILPAGLKSIGSAAFQSCSNLKIINLPDGLQSIGSNAFYGCAGLTTIELPDSLISLGIGAFRNTGLISVTLPDKLTSIGDSAFMGCTSLTSVYLPDKLTSIGGYAFSSCTNLQTIRFGVEIMNQNATIGEFAFDDVPDTVTIYCPEEGDVVALEDKLEIAGLETNPENYKPDSMYDEDTRPAQTSPEVPAGVKELLDAARVFGL